jgi:hypothetical protein
MIKRKNMEVAVLPLRYHLALPQKISKPKRFSGRPKWRNTSQTRQRRVNPAVVVMLIIPASRNQKSTMPYSAAMTAHPLTYAGMTGDDVIGAESGQNSVTRCHEMKTVGRNMSQSASRFGMACNLEDLAPCCKILFHKLELK